MSCASMSGDITMPEFIDMLALPYLARADAHLVGWRHDDAVDNARFRHETAAWKQALAVRAGRNFALYLQDTVAFAAALFGAWQAGKTIYLPSDTLPDTCKALALEVDGFLRLRRAMATAVRREARCRSDADRPAAARRRRRRPGGLHLGQHRRRPGDPEKTSANGQRSRHLGCPVRCAHRPGRRGVHGVAPAHLRPAVQSAVAAVRRTCDPCPQRLLPGRPGRHRADAPLVAAVQPGAPETPTRQPGTARHQPAASHLLVGRSLVARGCRGQPTPVRSQSHRNLRQLGNRRYRLAPAAAGCRPPRQLAAHAARRRATQHRARLPGSTLAPPARPRLAAYGGSG